MGSLGFGKCSEVWLDFMNCSMANLHRIQCGFFLLGFQNRLSRKTYEWHIITQSYCDTLLTAFLHSSPQKK